MKHITFAILLVFLLGSCWGEPIDNNIESWTIEELSETWTSAIIEEEQNIPETFSGEVLDDEKEWTVEGIEEWSEEAIESGSWEILEEVQDDVQVADVSEDTSGGQFIFKTDTNAEIKIYPIDHASAVVEWDDTTIYADPAHAIEWFESPDFVFVSHEHPDHFNTGALNSILTDDTMFVATQTVFDKLDTELQGKTTVMNNGDIQEKEDFTITAVPAYNIRADALQYHPQGVGNWYIFEKDGFRIYFSGDSEDTPEMRALEDIDIAFVSMNLPFTMSVESAANAVLEFAPKKVFPYHYRWKEWLSDIEAFKTAVETANNEIEVLFWDWYAE